ncbi:MAG: agmatine/peptidylarginine deiminase [Candidatus Tectimicrobiota bacterium]
MSANTPAILGYRMPAEWEPHAATWLAWPHNPITWGEYLADVQDIFLRMIAALQTGERVHLLLQDRTTAALVTQAMQPHGGSTDHLIMHQQPTADAWLRDSGPNFLTGIQTGQLALNHWGFNAWGNKYPDLLVDTILPQYIADLLHVPRFTPGIVLEGGSIDVNGRGTCLTTEQCLLNPNRNPQLQRADLEQYLRSYLGVQHIIWLGEGIVGDDTDGHVDDMARFVNPTTVVCALSEDPQDPNYHVLQDNYQRLCKAVDQHGQPLEVIPLPMPGPLGPPDSRLPASYANFYIANRVVLVPVYRYRHDQTALEILQKLFPERQVIGIPCEPLVWGFGAIHCVTQQQPEALSLSETDSSRDARGYA